MLDAYDQLLDELVTLAAPEWEAFAPESGTLGIPRASMPQIKSEHRGAMVNYFRGRGIEHEYTEVLPSTLKPSQSEFSPLKVEKARGFTGKPRPILISADNHVADGHHQWLSSLEDVPDAPIPAIRLNAPIHQVLLEAARFPSSSVDEESVPASSPQDKAHAPDEYDKLLDSLTPAPSARPPKSTVKAAPAPLDEYDRLLDSLTPAPAHATRRPAAPPMPHASLDPALSSHVGDIISSLKARGYDVRLGDTLRTPEQQAEKVRLGYSKTYNSHHLTGRAADLIVYENDKPQWDTKHPAWSAIGEEVKKRGLGWGGDFKTLYDPGHVELGGGASSSDPYDVMLDELAGTAQAHAEPDEYDQLLDGLTAQGDDEVDERVNSVPASVAVAPSLSSLPAPSFDPYLADDRARRDAAATADVSTVTFKLSRPLPDYADGAALMRDAYQAGARSRNVPDDYAETWLASHPDALRLVQRDTGEAHTPADLIGSPAYDPRSQTVRLELERLDDMAREYEAWRSVGSRAVDYFTDPTTTSGEKATGAAGKALDYATRPFSALSTGTAGLQRSVSTSIGALAGDEASQEVLDADIYSPVNIIKATWDKLKTGRTPAGYEQPIAEGLDLLYQQKNGMSLPAWRRMALEVIGDPLTYAALKLPVREGIDALKATRMGQRLFQPRGLTVLDIEKAAADGRYFITLKDAEGVTHRIETTAFYEGGQKPKIKSVAPGRDIEGIGLERDGDTGRIFHNGKPQGVVMDSDGTLRAAPIGGRSPVADPYDDLLDELTEQPLPLTVAAATAPRVGLAGRVLDVVGLPKSFLSSLDVSAPGRQGLILTVTEPRIAASAMRQQFRSLVSSKAYKDVERFLATHADSDLADASGLYRATLARRAGGLSGREEAFMSRIAGELPGVKHSERAYNAYLDVLRQKSFSKYADELRAAGLTFETHPEEFKALARFVNAATGRGNLPAALEKVAPVLNAMVFSPRNIASRLSLLSPTTYLNAPPAVRKVMMRKMLEFTGVAVSTLTAARLAGAEVNLDSASADFLKIRVGKTHYDVLGGFQQPMRLIGQLSTGLWKLSRGEKIKRGHDPLTVLARFVRSKASPVAGYAWSAYEGTTIEGDDFDAKTDAAKLFAPMFLQDLAEAYEEDGSVGVLKALPAGLGVGVQTYGEAFPKPIVPMLSAPVKDELDRLGLDLERLGKKRDRSASINPNYQTEGITGDSVRAFGGVVGRKGREVEGMGVDAERVAKDFSAELDSVLSEVISSPDYEAFQDDAARAKYLETVILNTHRRHMNPVRRDARGEQMEREKKVAERLERMSGSNAGRTRFKL